MLPVLTLLILLGALAVLALFHPSLSSRVSSSEQANDAATSVVALTGSTMGTGYRILLAGNILPEADKTDLVTRISKRLQHLDRDLFSTYAPDSQVSRFNTHALGEPMTVSGELITVMQAAMQVHTASEGAFDVTIKPLVDLWGFGTAGRAGTVPDAAAILAAREAMGMNRLQIDAGNSTLTRLAPVSVDLSAIAKGYAVDAIAGLLDGQGIEAYLVEIGGEVRVAGSHPEGRPWQLGIETPQDSAPTLYRTINTPLSGADKPLALAGSGSYRNYFVYEGTRYSHTINPVTGRPVEHRLESVTVMAGSAMLADAWATALSVLGPEAGMKLANELQLAAYFIVDEDGGFTARHSSAFTPYL